MALGVRFCFTRTLIHQRKLVTQVVHHILNEHREVVLSVVHPVGFILKIAGENNSAKLFNDVNHHVPVRLAVQLQLIDIPLALVVHQNGVYQRFNFFFKGCHLRPSLYFFYLFIP